MEYPVWFGKLGSAAASVRLWLTTTLVVLRDSRAGRIVSRWLPSRPIGWRRWTAAGAVALGIISIMVGPKALANLDEVERMPLASAVLDASDQPAFSIFEEYRIKTSLDAVSPHFVNALLAVEDERFYRHIGVMPTRMAAALWVNMRSGERAQGGSTITQQLARKTFLSDEKTFRRKFAEMALAMRLEWRYSKVEILQFYMNRVYFGRGLYGIEAASRGYFAKSARDLTLDEAALLAGLVKAPSAYAPPEHLARALGRREVVLARMVDAKFIDRATAAAAARTPVVLRDGAGAGDRFGYYFKNYVARELVEQFGWETVSEGGLRIYTTIDQAIQRAAEQQLAEGLVRIEKLPAFRHARRGQPPPAVLKASNGKAAGDPDYLQGALVAIDPRNGHVRAVVGGRDFGDSLFDRATQALRQAGSAFKPLLYAAALEAGYTPATVVRDLDDPIATTAGLWVPDDGHSTASEMTVRTALRTSSNRAAVQVLQDVGIPRTLAYVNRLGVEAPPAVPSMALGAGEVTLLSLTTAYGAFANGGTVHTPIFIRRVEDRDGQVLFQSEPRPHRAISEETAFLMANMLADVVDRGTGARARREGFTKLAGGKTGTTNDYKDAWFIGFTPTLVSGVWVGFDRPRTIMARGYATELAVPIWAKFMKTAAGDGNTWLAVPPHVTSVEICRLSGLRPGPGCGDVESVARDGTASRRSAIGAEYFRRGTEPQESCAMHGGAPWYDWVKRIIR